MCFLRNICLLPPNCACSQRKSSDKTACQHEGPRQQGVSSLVTDRDSSQRKESYPFPVTTTFRNDPLRMTRRLSENILHSFFAVKNSCIYKCIFQAPILLNSQQIREVLPGSPSRAKSKVAADHLWADVLGQKVDDQVGVGLHKGVALLPH